MKRRELTPDERRIVRSQLARRQSKFGIGSKAKKEQPPQVALRRSQLIISNSRVTPSPASAEREKAAPAKTPLAGAAAFSEGAP